VSYVEGVEVDGPQRVDAASVTVAALRNGVAATWCFQKDATDVVGQDYSDSNLVPLVELRGQLR
jgi:hypothetical protein